jgi:hypothetical protein
MGWQEEKATRQRIRNAEKMARLMQIPVPRAESIERDNHLAVNVATIAIGLEAMESLLIEKGVFVADELMGRLEKLAKEKAEAPTSPSADGFIPGADD